MAGEWVWFDLMTADVEGATRFYTTVFGWTTEEWPMGAETYRMFAAGGKTLGGIMAQPKEMAGAPPFWVGYVSVANVDESARRAEQLGGTVLSPPMDIPSVGRFATVRDPQGGVVSLFSSSEPGPAKDLRVLGHMGWHELSTQDAEGSWAFYSELFGWRKGAGMEMAPGMTYQMYNAGGPDLGGISPAMSPEQPTAWMFYVNVPDCAETLAKAKANGATALYEPMPVPGGGKAAAILDPQGGAIGIYGQK